VNLQQLKKKYTYNDQNWKNANLPGLNSYLSHKLIMHHVFGKIYFPVLLKLMKLVRTHFNTPQTPITGEL